MVLSRKEHQLVGKRTLWATALTEKYIRRVQRFRKLLEFDAVFLIMRLINLDGKVLILQYWFADLHHLQIRDGRGFLGQKKIKK